MDTLRFDGRAAIVTGAGRGLGRAHAEELARRGAAVVVNDLDDAPATDVAAAITEAGGRAVAVSGDVSLPACATAIVDAALDAFGRIDVVVNNAGGGAGGPFAEQTPDDFTSMVGSHLFGTANVTRAAWPHLLHQGYGRVVMTTSALGIWGGPASSAYAAAKGGIVGLAKALAIEGNPAGIRVNCVAPAAQTRMSAARFPKEGSRRWRPELVTPAVVVLAHETCPLQGATIAAFAGLFGRITSVQSRGHRFDARREVTAEDLVAELDAVTALDEPHEFVDGHLDALGTPLGLDLRAVVEASGARV